MPEAPDLEEAWDRDRLNFERDLALMEYKTHHEEIFKWNSYINQAVGAYLVLFSILATVLSQFKQAESPTQSLVDLLTLKRWIPIIVSYASIALLYVMYQFRFMIVSHNTYLITRLRDRLRSCGASAPIEWEVFIIGCRKPRLSRYIRWPVKHGINIVPYGAVVGGMFWYCCKFLSADLQDNATSAAWAMAFLHGAVNLVIPALLLLWCHRGFKHLSTDEKGAAAFAEGQPRNSC